MDRRKFLKFIGMSLAAAGVANITDSKILGLSEIFTDEQAAGLMALPVEESGVILASSFSAMLNEYLPIEFIRQELKKSDYFLAKITKD